MKLNKNVIYIILSIVILILIIIFVFYLYQNSNDFDNVVIEDFEQQAENICLQSGGEIDYRLTKEREEYRVCIFGENKECSLSDIFNNNCPEGGKLTIFAGPYNYCLSLGGEYIEKEDSLIEERLMSGDCLLKSGEVYNAFELYKNRFKNTNLE